MTRSERRYRTEKVAQKRYKWLNAGHFSRWTKLEIPSIHIYHKWNGVSCSCGNCKWGNFDGRRFAKWKALRRNKLEE